MRILIVDDERPARDKLRRLLTPMAGPDAIIDEAIDGVAALNGMARTLPDVVFLDIQMPEINGLEVAASLPVVEGQANPLIVFVTAYDQYAIAAFDANAIDYLLKPFDQARLQRAWQRVRERVQLRLQARAPSAPALMPVKVNAPAQACIPEPMSASVNAQVNPPAQSPMPASDPALASANANVRASSVSNAIANLAVSSSAANGPGSMPWSAAGPINQLLVSERGVTRVLPVERIAWLETADNYVILHLDQTPQQPLLRQTLAALLENLGPRFMRCHRRAAVRIACIDSIIAKGKGDCELVLHGGARVPCSRQYSTALMQQLGPDAN